ncbi:IS1380 family transposase [Blautia obeum]|uniref:IS1380 family transposase n=1 Tax=Blautia obeum TaxID=40520 RepID=UPI00156EAA8A|nr:IS1380 family transposase [Blautia obeum]NSG41070.1 IS1380 family transposase [Blautia obeum]
MSIVNTFSLQSNRQIKINFDGGDLSSDAGLLLIKEFISKLGIERLLNRSFKTNDSAVFRYHTDRDNLLQMIYMIMAGYFEDDASDELTKDPVFKAVLEKSALASQPTVSRFFNRMDEDTLKQFQEISQILRKRIYSIQMPQAVILDLDSTLLAAYGKQEGRAFNFHYRSNGYHPLVCYDGITGDLIKIQFRDGAAYSCTGVTDFLQPILDEYLNDYPTIHLLLRGDSGFATPDLYKQCEENGTSYVIRLMENFIKESKSGFDFSAVSSHNRIVNANRVQVHALAYNIFNWFRRLVLSAKMRKQGIDTVRLKLLKIATKVVHSARYITFKLCSSCPYKEEFYDPLSAIGKLNVQLE